MMMMILMVKIMENLNHHRHHNLVSVRQMDLFVSRHFPYSRDFVFSPLFWTLLEKVGRLEGGVNVSL